MQVIVQTLLAAWTKRSRRIILGAGIVIFSLLILQFGRHAIDGSSISLQFGGPRKSQNKNQGTHPQSSYNVSKVALLVEDRADPILAPLLIHFISVVPSDWRFRFMGSIDSVALVNSSVAIRRQVEIGKLDLTYIPSNMSTTGWETISRFLTTLWLYETVLQPAEWLLVFQTDSMLCANSRRSLNDFLEYDWVGAPWDINAKFGGNGGLSLRRVSAIVDVLKHETRLPDSEAEDLWLTNRLGRRPGAKLANGTISSQFSGEMLSGKVEEFDDRKGIASKKPNPGGLVKGIDDWRNGFYEPMGYHTGGSGSKLWGNVWGTPEMRKHIWDYCPEVKMTVVMDAARYIPGACNDAWKRDGIMGPDEDEYWLPEGLVPW